MIELRCPLEVTVTSRDNQKGLAFGVIDYGPEADLIWIVIVDTEEIWCVNNKEIRVSPNWTFGRRAVPTAP